MSATPRTFLAVLLIVYVAKQVVTLVVFPPFTGHDELAHYQYVRVLATEWRLPTLYTDTLPPDLYRYNGYAIEWEQQYGTPLYTAVHPPLYYALVTPIFRAARGLTPEATQYLLRAAAIPFGLLVVILSYAMTRAVFPRDSFLALTVPATVAFQPQLSYEAAMVNNDMVAIALFSLVLYWLVLTLRDGLSIRRAALIGGAAGLALLAKANALLGLPLIAATFWLASRGAGVSRVVRSIAVSLGVAAAISGPWWWFMARTYGDPMAFKALAALQPTVTRHEPFLDLLFSGSFAVERWKETWGEFGWKLIHVSPALTVALGVVMAVAVLGLLIYFAREEGGAAELDSWQRHALLLLAVTCLLSYASVVQFGTRFMLTQARYFFPTVNAAALLLMLGLRTWIPAPGRAMAQAAIVGSCVAVTVVIYTAYVIPYWYF